MEDETQHQIVLPIVADGEDPFIPFYEFNISLRMFLTAMIGGGIYLVIVKFLTGLLPLSTVSVAVAFAWIPILFLALAFIPVNGMPLEHYLSIRARFILKKKKYARIRKKGITDLEDFDWDSLQDKY